MKVFTTLLHREWMQHQRGWLVMLVLPSIIGVVAALFGQIQLNDSHEQAAQTPGPLVLALCTIAAMVALTLVITWAGTLLMSPSLARRDTQDRSIEFWLSLPTHHVQSVGASLFMHLLALPWAALGAGLLAGFVATPIVVGKFYSLGAWFDLPWGLILTTCLAFMVRMVVGVLLATLWLSPLILGTMAASAWLKRWGVPAVAAAVFIGSTLLAKIYNITVFNDALRYLLQEAGRAFIATGRGPQPSIHINHPDDVIVLLPEVAGWVLGDMLTAITSAATPGFVAALAVGVAAFGALVLRRQRGA